MPTDFRMSPLFFLQACAVQLESLRLQFAQALASWFLYQFAPAMVRPLLSASWQCVDADAEFRGHLRLGRPLPGDHPHCPRLEGSSQRAAALGVLPLLRHFHYPFHYTDCFSVRQLYGAWPLAGKLEQGTVSYLQKDRGQIRGCFSGKVENAAERG